MEGIRFHLRYFPAAPVQCSLNLGSSTPNGGAEAYAELEKALNIVGDYRLNTANNALRFVSTRGYAAGGNLNPTNGDFKYIYPKPTAGGQSGAAACLTKPPFNAQIGSSCFAMATSLETSNG